MSAVFSSVRTIKSLACRPADDFQFSETEIG